MKKRPKIRSSVNNLYDMYSYPEKLIKHKSGFNLTQGIYDVVFDENIEFILNIITQHKKNSNFETWHFCREQYENKFSLTGRNKLGNKFLEIPNIVSDFYFDDFVIIKKETLLCLPIEEKLY